MNLQPHSKRGKPARWAWAAVGLYGALLAWPAWGQNMIRAITGSSVGGVDTVRVELSEPLAAVPSGFAVQTPPRIALDLPGVGSVLGRSVVDIQQGNVRSVSVAEAGDRARLVLNLKQASSYAARVEGRTLVLVLATEGSAAASAASPASASSPPGVGAGAAPVASSPPAAPAPAVSSAPAAALPAAGASMALRDVDFRRSPDGAGRIVVSLPGPQSAVDVRQQGQNLVVEFARSSLPETLRRRLDVTDFGTPVQTITSTQADGRVRMVVEPRGAWEHSAYQTDTQFVLEVRPLRVDPDRLVQGTGYKGEKLSLNFQKIDVRALLQVIADFTSFNVVTSDAVKGDVTLRLKDVPWDQALDIILESNGLGVRKNGNVLLIAPKKELLDRDQAELEAKRRLSDLEPLRTQAFQLNYAKAEEVARAINASAGGGGAAAPPAGGAGGAAAPAGGATGGAGASAAAPARILSSRGSVIFEARTNQLFVTDIPIHLEKVQSLITRIDVPVRQVLIEARIVEADDSFGRSLGVKLGANDQRTLSDRSGRGITIGNDYSSVGASTGQSGATATAFNNSTFVNLPADVSRLGATAATVALTLFSSGQNRFLNLELSALESEGKGKILSSPRVVTADKIKALIEQGEELPYQQATSSGATSVAFRKANLKLEVTPQITPEGSVILDVDVNKDSVGRATAGGFAIDTKHIKTQVLVENGGTVVIGGIFIQSEKEQVNKVPVLGDVPFVGNLFKNRARSVAKTELLVFITPRVVSEQMVGR